MAIRALGIAPVPAQQNTNVNLVLLRFQITEILPDAVQLCFRIAFKDEATLGLGEVAERHVEADAASRLLAEIVEPFDAARFGPGLNGAFIDREAAVRHYEFERVVDCIAEALAARAGAGGAVEAEENRLGRIEIDVVVLAAEALAEEETVLRGGVQEDDFARFAIANLHGIDEALVEVRRDGDAVRENIDRLLPVNFQQRFGRGEFERCAILPETIEAARAKLVEPVFRNLMLVVLHREEDEKARTGGLDDHCRRYLIDRIALH